MKFKVFVSTLLSKMHKKNLHTETSFTVAYFKKQIITGNNV